MQGPEIFFKLGDEKEGGWLDPIFKVGKHLVGGIDEGDRSHSWWLTDLEEEEWVGGLWMMNVHIRLEELSFNAHRYW